MDGGYLETPLLGAERGTTFLVRRGEPGARGVLAGGWTPSWLLLPPTLLRLLLECFLLTSFFLPAAAIGS